MVDHSPSDLPSRMTEKIEVDPSSGCWLWTAFIQSNGYGKVGIKGRIWLAHRAVYTLLEGHVPSDLVIDHICRTRHCVNPTHMRVVTQRENTMEPRSLSASRLNANKTHCVHGHPLVITRSGVRSCRECPIVRDRARNPKRTEALRLRRLAARGGRPVKRPSKITDEDVARLRQLRSEGMRGTELAALFGISKAQVSRIGTGKRRALSPSE